MKITAQQWNRYISVLRELNNKAAEDMIKYMASHDIAKIGDTFVLSEVERKALTDYAFGIATKYGEGASAAAAEMYDAIAVASKASVPPAVPAPTATYGEVAKTVNGTLKQSPEIVPGAVGRLVKTAGVDTTMQNAIRDGAYWAWVPQGDTCAFCIMLASKGWQRASKKALKNGHAEHIHANCDCTYVVRFGDDLFVEGYDPQQYLDMYQSADGTRWQDKLNSMRRQFYAENKATVGTGPVAEEFIPKNVFKPGKTTAEVEDIVREFVDEDRFGAIGVSFKSVDLGIANDTAKAVFDFFNKYDVPKLGGISAPVKNTTREKMMSGGIAVYSPVRNALLLNKDSLKSVKVAQKTLLAEKLTVTKFLEHPELYDMNKLSPRVKRVLEQSQISGRGLVAENVTDCINHELGHALEKQLRKLPNYDDVIKRMDKYAPKISGYATDDVGEYIAESFASYCKGEDVVDPQLVKLFRQMEKK